MEDLNFKEFVSSLNKKLQDFFDEHHCSVSWKKKDGSFVTNLDIEVNKILINLISSFTKDIEIISEETYTNNPAQDSYWLIDPIDGTSNVLSGGSFFTVNAAFLQNNSLVFSYIFHPSSKDYYFAIKNRGAYKNGKKMSAARQKKVILVSENHLTEEKDIAKISKALGLEVLQMSSSLKFCKLADNNATCYFRAGNTMEWDTAAGQLLCEEAGIEVLGIKNQKTLQYNKLNLINNGFVAAKPNIIRKIFTEIEAR